MQREKPKFISSHDISALIDKEGTVGDKLISIQVPSLLTNELENILAKAIDKLPKNCAKKLTTMDTRQGFMVKMARLVAYAINSHYEAIKLLKSKHDYTKTRVRHLKDMTLFITAYVLFGDAQPIATLITTLRNSQ